MLEHHPAATPQLSVADEQAAYRNWPIACPEAMVMLVKPQSGGLRGFRANALCFGDRAAVYAYNRIRTFLATFFRVEFGIAVWHCRVELLR